MKKQSLLILALAITLLGYGQNKNELKNTVGLSVPVIFNNSNGVFYSLSNRKKPTGKAISYGVSVTYSKSLYQNWFFNIGVGYFKQSFNIIRPFNFDGDTVTNLLYSTKNYSYHCFQFQAGIGYGYKLNERFKLNGLLEYKILKSFKQKYIPTGLSGYQHKSTQTNNKNFKIGNQITLSLGVEKMITKNIGVSANIVIPIITKWNNDEVFTNYYYADDSQKIAENRFTIGTVISCKYHF